MRIKFAFALAFIERQGISQTSLVWQNTSDLRQLFKLLSSCQSQLEKKNDHKIYNCIVYHH